MDYRGRLCYNKPKKWPGPAKGPSGGGAPGKMRSNLIKAGLVCLVLWMPLNILYTITLAHLMMLVESTALAYLAGTLLFGVLLALPFLVAIGKSGVSLLKKAGLCCGAVSAGALMLLLSVISP